MVVRPAVAVPELVRPERHWEVAAGRAAARTLDPHMDWAAAAKANSKVVGSHPDLAEVAERLADTDTATDLAPAAEYVSPCPGQEAVQAALRLWVVARCE